MISTHKSVDSKMLNQMMFAFKQFERKIDKLQDDVQFQGKTLTDLRTMVSNLAGPVEPKVSEGKPVTLIKHPSKKTTAIQYYEEYAASMQEPLRSKKILSPPLANNKFKARSLQGQKIGMRASTADQPFMNKAPSSPKGVKHSSRLPKADAPRKANTIRTQKIKAEKRRSKPKKNIIIKEKSK